MQMSPKRWMERPALIPVIVACPIRGRTLVSGFSRIYTNEERENQQNAAQDQKKMEKRMKADKGNEEKTTQKREEEKKKTLT